ncbi:MAG: hypothetical protein KDA92_08360 [Planctomycetales bacterium]|nr:hypothetical protein [Planctomycetales bacterium]MCA9167637.1 hypothetical protein [Planctomycetales bacterium]
MSQIAFTWSAATSLPRFGYELPAQIVLACVPGQRPSRPQGWDFMRRAIFRANGAEN